MHTNMLITPSLDGTHTGQIQTVHGRGKYLLESQFTQDKQLSFRVIFMQQNEQCCVSNA